MKTILSVLVLAIIMASCNQPASTSSEVSETEMTNTSDSMSANEATEESVDSIVSIDSILYRGDSIIPDGAIPASYIKTAMEEFTEMNLKIETVIKSCCQKKGCWMKVDLGNDEEMRVTFKDYGFFVPKNSAGYKVIMEGKAYYDTTSVDMLRHYAEDAGKPEEEINAITQAEVELLFESNGLIIYPN